MNTPRRYSEAAAELGVSEQWLKDATPSVPLPHSKFSVDKDGKPSTKGRGSVVFYDEDLAAIRAMFAVAAPVARAARTSGPLTRRRAS